MNFKQESMQTIVGQHESYYYSVADLTFAKLHPSFFAGINGIYARIKLI